MEWFKRKTWLTASTTKRALFCSPCLLFGNTTNADSVWTTDGYKDLKHLAERTVKHESSKSHINCAMKLGLLGGVNIMAQIDSAYQRNILEHNKQTGEADIVPKALWEVRTGPAWSRRVSRLSKPRHFWDDVRGRHQAEKTLRFGESNLFLGADGCINATCKDIVFLQGFVHLAACFVADICFSCAFCFILYATRVPQA